jgi:hypothetical protein
VKNAPREVDDRIQFRRRAPHGRYRLDAEHVLQPPCDLLHAALRYDDETTLAALDLDGGYVLQRRLDVAHERRLELRSIAALERDLAVADVRSNQRSNAAEHP